MTEPLAPDLTHAVLRHLGVSPAPPDRSLLNRLLLAYGQTVPWESASRIARRAGATSTAACPRWSDEFWRDAIALGTGGTCFESNRAFFALLRSLGYDGYLTLNNMHESVGCHTAIVLSLDDRPWLVDVGYPVYAALPLDPAQPTEQHTPYFSYTVQPVAPSRYVIENRPHPRPYMFDLLDTPIHDATYCAATTDDYGDQGLFLNRLIVRKIVDGRLSRFDSNERPYRIERFSFPDGARTEQPLDENPIAALSRHFGIAAQVLEQAFQALRTQT